MKLDVVHFSRRPQAGQHSIEKVFEVVRGELPERFRVVTVTSGYYSKGLRQRVATVLEARRIAAPVVHILGDVTYAALARPAASTVITIHDAEFLRRGSPAKNLAYSWLWLRLPARHAAVVTVPSAATLRELQALGAGEASSLRLIPHPVSDAFFASQRRPTPRSTGGRPKVLVVGTAPNKNLLTLAAALDGSGSEVVVVGRLDAEQRRAFAKARVAVREMGTLPDEAMPGVYSDADVLAFVSTTEGFGVPILEAQASGLAVVTSDLEPHRDVAGGAARLVDPRDPASIRAGVDAVVGDESYRRHLVAAGFVNAKRFSPARIASMYADVYDEVAPPGASARTPTAPSDA